MKTETVDFINDIEANMEQFQLGDHRGVDEAIRDVALLGYIPSFCTGCYRLGRTGGEFMDLAKVRAGEARRLLLTTAG